MPMDLVGKKKKKKDLNVGKRLLYIWWGEVREDMEKSTFIEIVRG